MVDAPDTAGSYSFDWLVLDSIRRMRDYHTDGDIDKYTIAFKYCFKMVIPWLSVKTRARVQDDYEKYTGKLKALDEAKELNPESKKLEKRKLSEEFADVHELLIFSSLSRLGIIKVSDEGNINFDNLDIDTMALLIRSQKGLKGMVKKLEKKPEVVKDGLE